MSLLSPQNTIGFALYSTTAPSLCCKNRYRLPMASLGISALAGMCVVLIGISYHWVCFALETCENLIHAITPTICHWVRFVRRACDVFDTLFSWVGGVGERHGLTMRIRFPAWLTKASTKSDDSGSGLMLLPYYKSAWCRPYRLKIPRPPSQRRAI
jgi:hypothetical protein